LPLTSAKEAVMLAVVGVILVIVAVVGCATEEPEDPNS
jgi:hypothetical protein